MTMPVRTRQENRTKAETGKGDTPAATAVDRQALLGGLNHDLAGEYQAILMYTHYSAKLTGPYRRELRALFQAEIADEQGHAQFLADKVAALGGEPTTEPRPVPHAEQPREMLGHALAAEKVSVRRSTGRSTREFPCLPAARAATANPRLVATSLPDPCPASTAQASPTACPRTRRWAGLLSLRPLPGTPTPDPRPAATARSPPAAPSPRHARP